MSRRASQVFGLSQWSFKTVVRHLFVSQVFFHPCTVKNKDSKRTLFMKRVMLLCFPFQRKKDAISKDYVTYIYTVVLDNSKESPGAWCNNIWQGDQLAIGKESQTWNGNKHVSLFRLFKEYAQAVGTNKPHGRICLSKIWHIRDVENILVGASNDSSKENDHIGKLVSRG
uniref:T12C22.22 protein n=1 Tax=Arabidopsis thaliana TaxID=3702 RepID=Q9LPD6_ARATH|nr:Contains weak similarity to plasma membrane H+ ATPase from Phaseolus vulgaris gb/X94936. EST gb/T22206 comes from this gene [Arabidopsis thaliana]